MQRNPFNRRDLIEAHGFEVVEGVCRSEADLADLLSDADGALIGVMPLTSRSVLECRPKLKVVSRLGVGVGSIDLDAVTELGILATNVPGFAVLPMKIEGCTGAPVRIVALVPR